MDPNSGRLYTEDEVDALSQKEQAKLVRMQGKPEQIRMVSDAVKAAARRRNKAARKARRVQR